MRELSVEHDKDRLLEYMRAEQNAPRWYRLSNETKDTTEESFLKFCSEHRLFELGDALLYVKPGSVAQIHFSVLRGAKVDEDEIAKVRDLLFSQGTKLIYGSVLKQNRPLRKLCERMGMYWNGVQGEDKAGFKYLCYAIDRRDLFVDIPTDLLLN